MHDQEHSPHGSALSAMTISKFVTLELQPVISCWKRLKTWKSKLNMNWYFGTTCVIPFLFVIKKIVTPYPVCKDQIYSYNIVYTYVPFLQLNCCLYFLLQYIIVPIKSKIKTATATDPSTIGMMGKENPALQWIKIEIKRNDCSYIKIRIYWWSWLEITLLVQTLQY